MAYRQSGIANQGGYRERGVVLHALKYSERQLIIHMLTQNHGRMSYITNISRSATMHSASRNIFQPLFVLEFEATTAHSTMHRLAQCEPSPPLHDIPMDIVKMSISVFISELLYRIVREPVDDPNMYAFVEESIIALNSLENGVANFHLWFLTHLAYFMGYAIPRNYTAGKWLDIKHGEFTSTMPVSGLRVAPQYAEILSRMNEIPVAEIHNVSLSRNERVPLLNALVDYYSYHCDTINSVKSIAMMSELF